MDHRLPLSSFDRKQNAYRREVLSQESRDAWLQRLRLDDRDASERRPQAHYFGVLSEATSRLPSVASHVAHAICEEHAEPSVFLIPEHSVWSPDLWDLYRRSLIGSGLEVPQDGPLGEVFTAKDQDPLCEALTSA